MNRKIVFILFIPFFILFSFSKVKGQNKTKQQADTTEQTYNFFVIEEKPEFPGGQSAMLKYIAEHTKYPEFAKENGITGKVFVQFVINKKGKVTDVEVIRDVEPHLNKEAIRVIKNMPKWKPGKQKGKIVKVQFQIPINFTLY